jgi:hypothetical protein
MFRQDLHQDNRDVPRIGAARPTAAADAREAIADDRDTRADQREAMADARDSIADDREAAADGLSAVAAHAMLNSSAAVLLGTSTLHTDWQGLSTAERIRVLAKVQRHATYLADAIQLMIQPDGSTLTYPTAVTLPAAEDHELLRPEDSRGATMPKKPQIAVTPRDDGRWAVQEIGEARSGKLYDRKGDAEAAATARGTADGADVVVEDVDGDIERWDAHEADPPGADTTD